MMMISLIVVLALVGCTVAEEQSKANNCKLSWTKSANTQVKGLTEEVEFNSEEACKAGCVAESDCWSIDWNFEENSCWFGSRHDPTERVADDTVNHWDLHAECQEITGDDCGAIQSAFPGTRSGVYNIKVPGQANLVPVYCDMDTACGGWTVLQRRKDGSVNFKRTWKEYAAGFGNLNGEFWLGNDIISALTNARSYKLRVDIGNFEGQQRYAEYNNFEVAGAASKYKLTFSNCSYFGNAGNSLGPAIAVHSHYGMKFSTYDQDNDNFKDSCSALYNGAGWWYNACQASSLNGLYNSTEATKGVFWYNPQWYVTLKFSEMKIRSIVY